MLWTISQEALEEAARQAAANHNLDPALVCAVCEQESGDPNNNWQWRPWAIRYEPAFYERYTKPMHLTDTEEYSRAISWGLLQLMGETARELGYKGPIAKLCEPDVGLDWGCLKLANCMKAHGSNLVEALLAYNGGGNLNYPDEVMARMGKYKPNPQITQSPDLSTQV